MRGTVWIGCALALSGLVGTLLHAQISRSGQEEARRLSESARGDAHDRFSHAGRSPKPSGKPKVAKKKGSTRKSADSGGRRGNTARKQEEGRVLLQRRPRSQEEIGKRRKMRRQSERRPCGQLRLPTRSPHLRRSRSRSNHGAGVQRAPGGYHDSEIRTRRGTGLRAAAVASAAARFLVEGFWRRRTGRELPST